MPSSATADTPRYVIGIDLGTTNSAVSYIDREENPGAEGSRTIHSFEIPQLVAQGEFGHAPVLPSFLYLPGEHELPDGSTAVPWDAERDYAVGVFAREQGARVPGRLVASAKSWLCHSSVDRTAPILPWGAPDEVPKVTPVEATTRYLQHLREAWNARPASGPDERFEDQLLILTVPASFDEVARELTVEAAEQAGLPDVVLLEEPLAAFYDWLADHHTGRDDLEDGDLILVCDVGGGTTDFSIVGVRSDEEGLRFDRLAVGDHLMLGGDNMDNALGRSLEAELAGETGALDTQRWHQLVHQCRRAKEQLLADDAPGEVDIAVAGTGSRLIEDTLTGHLQRDEVRTLLLNGFFPEVELDASLQQTDRKGLTELGLPYEKDPALPRHLAAFWRQSQPYLREHTDRDALYPDHVLFNGGVFNAPLLRARVLDQIQQWFAPVAGAGWAPHELRNERLDVAVAHGAAQYGRVRLGEGVRVGSGSPRAYYVGIDAGTDRGDTGPTAMCLVPRGAPEGFEDRLDAQFEARANQPVTFHLFSSSTRTGDQLGDVVALDADDITALPPIRTVLKFGKRVARTVPVQLGVRFTEIGTLQLWCQSVHTDHRWRLQFDVREAPDTAQTDDSEPALSFQPSQIEDAIEACKNTFETADGRPPDTLWNALEVRLDAPREDWPLPVLRTLADTLLDQPHDHSPEHEAVWFDVLGYCLRPGYGDAVDDWRMDQAWIIHLDGLHDPQRPQNRMAWWSFWRRAGAGLPANKQEQFYYEARPFIQREVRTKKDHRVYSRRMKSDEKLAAWMTLSSFERVSSDIKRALGELLLDAMDASLRPRNGELWALGRVGARHPIYGPIDRLVPRADLENWLHRLLTMHLRPRDPVAHTLVHLARATEDRTRAVSDEMRNRVHRWLRKMDDPAPFRELLQTPSPQPDHPTEAWFTGEPPPEEGEEQLDPHGITYSSETDA
jgi:hypothetical protein